MSSDLDIKFPEIHYDGAHAYMYNYLMTDPDSPFLSHTHAEIFLFAMALAKRDRIAPKDLEDPKKMPSSAFSGRMRALMRSVMMDERGNVYSIGDNTAMRRMCEKYANAGIARLYLSIKERPEGKHGEDVLAELIRSQ